MGKNEEKKEKPEPTSVQKETPKSNNETKPTPNTFLFFIFNGCLFFIGFPLNNLQIK